MPAAAARALLWVVLLAPLGVQIGRWVVEAIYYGEFLHWSGVQGTRLLLLTLAITPLRRFLPRLPGVAWLGRRRRDLGIATAVYAVAHAVAYMVRKADASLVLGEALEIGLLTGWIAAVVLVVLALTSNDASVRRLGRRWRILHRSVHAAAVLTVAHWILTAFDPTTGWIHAGVLAGLLLARWPRRRRMAAA